MLVKESDILVGKPNTSGSLAVIGTAVGSIFCEAYFQDE